MCFSCMCAKLFYGRKCYDHNLEDELKEKARLAEEKKEKERLEAKERRISLIEKQRAEENEKIYSGKNLSPKVRRTVIVESPTVVDTYDPFLDTINLIRPINLFNPINHINDYVPEPRVDHHNNVPEPIYTPEPSYHSYTPSEHSHSNSYDSGSSSSYDSGSSSSYDSGSSSSFDSGSSFGGGGGDS